MNVETLPLPVTVLLGKVSLPHTLLLQEGDVLVLDQPINHPLSILVAGEKRFQGFPGSIHGNKGVQIDV